MKLHRQLGISYNAALHAPQAEQVMMERDRGHPSAESSSTMPTKTPFVAAVETNAEGHPLRVKLTGQ